MEETKKLIEKANSIGIIASNEKLESFPVSLSLFYSLKKINKNVNLLTEEIPKKFRFLVPSTDFISSSKNFIISVKNPGKSEISEVFYEKKEDCLNFYIKTKRGSLKKNNISFKVLPEKNDLLIFVGVDKISKDNIPEGTSVININNLKESLDNNFTNILEEGSSLSEITSSFFKKSELEIDKKVANCLLSGLIYYYDNFQKTTDSSSAFKLAAELKEKGALHQKIVKYLKFS